MAEGPAQRLTLTNFLLSLRPRPTRGLVEDYVITVSPPLMHFLKSVLALEIVIAIISDLIMIDPARDRQGQPSAALGRGWPNQSTRANLWCSI